MVPTFPHAGAFAASFKGFCQKWRALKWLQAEIFRNPPHVSSSEKGIWGKQKQRWLVHSCGLNAFSCISYPLNWDKA